MRFQFSSSSLLALSCLGCAAQQLSDAPSRENFYRRGQVSATVIGNYVYFDGGEISQLVDGKPPGQQNYQSNSVNSTISIDLSKSWTTSDVVMRTIERPWYSKMNQVIWTDREAGHFYLWGGTWIRGRNMTENTLWKFTPDGNGAGTWTVEPAANTKFFNDLHQSERSVFVSTKDTGFAIGGIASGWTGLYRASNQIIPGMVAFNMKTKIWQNGTTAFSPFDSLLGGTAEYVPFGPNGLVVVLGGTAHPVNNGKVLDEDTARHFDFHNLTLFDPQTKRQYWQVATGTIPPSPRIAFCTAGFQNPDSGYEIFLFGGSNARDRFVYDDAYVLSLPGFVWTKVPTSPAGLRRSLACVPVGKRQVLSIGGTSIGDSKSKGFNEQDPAPQGLLLFDITELKWKDSYDPNAAAYVRAADIEAWYSNGSFDAVQWSSDTVRELFSAESTDTSPFPSQTADPSTTADPSDDTPASQSIPVGAIAGGVVGGIAGIAIIAAVAWLLIRRRRNTDSVPIPGSDRDDQEGSYTSETTDRTRTEMPVQEYKTGPMELNTYRDHAELVGGMRVQQYPKTGPTELNPEPEHAELAGSMTYPNPIPENNPNVAPVEMDAKQTR